VVDKEIVAACVCERVARNVNRGGARGDREGLHRLGHRYLCGMMVCSTAGQFANTAVCYRRQRIMPVHAECLGSGLVWGTIRAG